MHRVSNTGSNSSFTSFRMGDRVSVSDKWWTKVGLLDFDGSKPEDEYHVLPADIDTPHECVLVYLGCRRILRFTNLARSSSRLLSANLPRLVLATVLPGWLLFIH